MKKKKKEFLFLPFTMTNVKEEKRKNFAAGNDSFCLLDPDSSFLLNPIDDKWNG